MDGVLFVSMASHLATFCALVHILGRSYLYPMETNTFKSLSFLLELKPDICFHFPIHVNQSFMEYLGNDI